jgi:hypothetical protein
MAVRSLEIAPLRHRADYRCAGLAVTETQSAFRTRQSSSAHSVDGRVQINKRLSTLRNFPPFHLDLQDCFHGRLLLGAAAYDPIDRVDLLPHPRFAVRS